QVGRAISVALAPSTICRRTHARSCVSSRSLRACPSPTSPWGAPATRSSRRHSDPMRILVVGSGGREHALVWALQRSGGPHDVLAAPGNAGIAVVAPCVPVDVGDSGAVARVAEDVGADLVVVGPEVPLVAGAAQAVRAGGRLAFGPDADGARLEG